MYCDLISLSQTVGVGFGLVNNACPESAGTKPALVFIKSSY